MQIIIIISCERAAVRRRVAGNTAEVAVRDALKGVRGPVAIPPKPSSESTHPNYAWLGCRI